MKIFKNMMLVVALIAMNGVDAKQVGGAKRPMVTPSTVTQSSVVQEQGLSARQQEMLRREEEKKVSEQRAAEEKAAQERVAQERKLREQAGKGAAPQVSGPVSSEQWNEMEDQFYNAIDAGNLRAAHKLITRMENVTNPTHQQKISLRGIKLSLKQQLIIQRAETAAQQKKKASNRLRSGLGEWWSGQAGKIENYKDMIIAKLDDIEKYPTSREKYPTLQSKKEALNLGLEFFDVQYNDPDIMKKAVEVAQTLPLKFAITKQDEQKQAQINALISALRKHYEFDVEDSLDASLSNKDKINYLETYLKNIKT